jgi:hypothetical protein
MNLSQLTCPSVALISCCLGCQKSDPLPMQMPVELCNGTSNSKGHYRLEANGSCRPLVPHRVGRDCGAATSLDAAFILQRMAGKRVFSSKRELVCDVTGDGA